MPQLDYTMYPSQIFWLCISLVILWVFVRKEFIPKITAMLDRRYAMIRAAEDEIELLKQAVETSSTELADTIRVAKDELKALEHELQQKAFEEHNANKKIVEKEVSSQLEELKKQVLQEQRAFLENIPDLTKELVEICLHKMLSTSLDEKIWDVIKQNIVRN